MYNGLTVPILLLKHNGEKYSPVSSVMPGYGPFLEMDAAIAELTSEFRGIENVPVGYTFCLIENDKPVEYWFTEAGNPESIEKKVIVSSEESHSNEVWEKSGLGYKIKNSTNNVEEGNHAVATGLQNKASGVQTFVSGNANKVTGNFAAGFGNNNKASGESSFASGMNTESQGTNSHTEGDDTKAIGESSHAEGVSTQAIGMYSHSEGLSSKAQGVASHVEGNGSVASGRVSHAEGSSSASGDWSHSEGQGNAQGLNSHSEGNGVSEGNCAHSEGSGYAIGNFSHAEGLGTKTMNEGEHACGKYNETEADQIFSIGCGQNDNIRKNAIKVLSDGRVYAYHPGSKKMEMLFSPEIYADKENIAFTWNRTSQQLTPESESVKVTFKNLFSELYIDIRYLKTNGGYFSISGGGVFDSNLVNSGRDEDGDYYVQHYKVSDIEPVTKYLQGILNISYWGGTSAPYPGSESADIYIHSQYADNPNPINVNVTITV